MCMVYVGQDTYFLLDQIVEVKIKTGTYGDSYSVFCTLKNGDFAYQEFKEYVNASNFAQEIREAINTMYKRMYENHQDEHDVQDEHDTRDHNYDYDW